MSTVGQDPNAPWWMKYGARGVGTASGIIAMGLGFFNCLTFSAMCLVAGIYQMFAGFIVVSAEAPCCCMFIEFVQRYSSFVEDRPVWQKAIVYILLSIPGVIMCPRASTIFGSGFIFLTGTLYGMMALGKKSPKEAMMAAASRLGGGGGTAGMQPVPGGADEATSQTAVLMEEPPSWQTNQPY
ncbi:TVP18/Calcium channel flower [Trinorchestia longiramus]|nr:TVP18/Calcium channel flower [Trinorchestia longiramus]